MISKVGVTLYRWAGSLGPLRITSECSECDFAVAVVRDVMSAHPDWPVQFEVKPWLNHVRQALSYGGWHAPVLIVDNRLVTQGRVPSYRRVESAIQSALDEQRQGHSERPDSADAKVPGGCC